MILAALAAAFLFWWAFWGHAIANAYEETSPPVEQSPPYQGFWLDDDLWSFVTLPDGTLVCQEILADSTGAARVECMHVPPGSIILVPTPRDGTK